MLSILNLADILAVCFKSEKDSIHTTRTISWLQQNQERVIINVDGNSMGNPGLAGFGGLARNPDGGWIFGFSGHISHAEILKAELIGIFQGLNLARNRGIRILICYSDSMSALKLIADQHNSFHKYATITQDIKDLLALPWRVDLRHMLREGNQCADYFAKLGAASVEKLQIFEVRPVELRLCLSGDAAGTAYPSGYPRLVPAP